MLAEAITQETPISIGVILGVGGLVFSAGIMAIIAAVTTRVSTKKDIEALLKADIEVVGRVAKLETWKNSAQTKLALIHDRQARASGTGSYPALGDDE